MSEAEVAKTSSDAPADSTAKADDSLLDDVDQALGDRREGETLVQEYRQKGGE